MADSQPVEDSQRAQLRVIRSIVDTLGAAGIRAWLFGGWGLDARLGRITREHGDVEFWIERGDAGRSKVLLVRAGATALMTQPPDEACEFEWDGAAFSTAYFDRRPDGTFNQEGRWSDWVFPVGSFGHDEGILEGVVVPRRPPCKRADAPGGLNHTDDVMAAHHAVAHDGVMVVAAGVGGEESENG